MASCVLVLIVCRSVFIEFYSSWQFFIFVTISDWAKVPPEAIVFRSSDVHSQRNAILAGAGIGFVAVTQARDHPALRQVMVPRGEWAAPLWLVTHMDLHRTTKVQAFLRFLKARARDWQG